MRTHMAANELRHGVRFGAAMTAMRMGGVSRDREQRRAAKNAGC